MSEKKIPYKIYLEESEMPREWYNVRADMKNKPAPLLKRMLAAGHLGRKSGKGFYEYPSEGSR